MRVNTDASSVKKLLSKYIMSQDKPIAKQNNITQSKQPQRNIIKMFKESESKFFQRPKTCHLYEKLLNISNKQGNVSQIHYKMSGHIH